MSAAGPIGVDEVAVAGILDALPAGVTVRLRDGELLYANRRALESMGIAGLEELRRQPIRSVFDRFVVEDEAGHRVEMEDLPSVRLLAGETADPLVIRTVDRASGEVRWERLQSTPLPAPASELTAAVTVIEDITAEKEAELRTSFLAEASRTLMGSLDYEETLANVGWLAVPRIADWCAVDLVGEQGLPQRVVVAHRDPAKVSLAEQLDRYAPSVPDPEVGIGKVLRTGATEIYPVIPDERLVEAAVDEEHLRLLRSVGFRSALLVPLRARGRTLGVLTLVTDESLRTFGPRDQAFAEQLAERAATAVDNARLATAQRVVAETLQRSLLPSQVPSIPGWEVATLYRAADSAEGVDVGGDFYDFVETPGGWVALLGDVTGRGLAASAMTLLVRHGARFVGRHEESPAVILAHINDALRDQGELSLCSAVCARLGRGQLAFSSAGHPSPLLLRADGRVEELARTGPILGAWEGGWQDRPVEVGVGDTLFMYTDGLTEMRGSTERYGTGRLRGLLESAAGASPAELIEALRGAIGSFAAEEQADDTAAVALRFSQS